MPILILNSEEDAKRIYGESLNKLALETIFFTDTIISPAKVLDELNPDLLLLSLEWLPQWRLFSALARKRNIPVVYVMDGVIEWSYIWNNQSYVQPDGTVLQPLIADHLCVIGRHPARILSSLGLADKIHLIGLPRLDTFRSRRHRPTSKYPTILITAARTAAHNTGDRILVKQALRDLKQFFSKRKEITALWRIESAIASELEVPPYDLDIPIERALIEIDGLISFPSTTLLEGMLAGVPAAQIDYRPTPSLVQTAWNISADTHIQPVVHELLYPPAEKLAYQNACLEDELESGKASDRLAMLLKNALTKVDFTPRDVQKETTCGPLDFRQVHSQLSCFALSDLSLMQYELDACYRHLDQLETELSTVDQEISRPLPPGMKHLFPGTSTRLDSARRRIAKLIHK